MRKMSQNVDRIVSAYTQLAKIPSVVGGRLSQSGKTVSSVWSVRNLDRGKITKFAFSTTLDDELKVVAESEFGTDVSNELLSAVSPDGKLRAVIREHTEKDSKRQLLEVWRSRTLEHSIDLTALDVHGEVYADSEFKSLDWSPDLGSIVYVAEKKLPKSEAFIKRKPVKDESKTESKDEPITKGEEYVYKQDWGEQLVGKHLSVIALCDLETETVRLLGHSPESLCPGQVRFSPDGKYLVGVAWQTEPRRLGLIFCTNRPSFIFTIRLDGSFFARVSAEGLAVRSPRFVGSELAWLQRPAGGPHHACHQLVHIAFPPREHRVLTAVDMIGTEVMTANQKPFHGVYSAALPERGASADGRLLFTTQQRTQLRSYVVQLQSGRLVDITDPEGSTSILDVQDDVVLATRTTLKNPSQLVAARLPAAGSEHEIRWLPVSSPADVPEQIQSYRVQHLDLESGDGFAVGKFSALYFGPDHNDKVPLVVWPHGGPHSAFADAYSLEAALFAMLGYACLQINYRGSTGAGQASVDFLPGHVGTADVTDCRVAAAEAVKRFPVAPERLGLVGGSHGGFLVAQLSGQHPEMFRCVVARNLIVDIATMFRSTDFGRINYRGSTGAGQASVDFLPGHVGTADVTDCRVAADEAVKRFPVAPERLGLVGGSHGGFLVAQLSGQHPEMFRCVVARNPVIDVAAMFGSTDIADWCAVEAGFDFMESGPVSEAQLVAMRRASPLAHAHLVRAPTALMLGTGDKRVPHYQGLEYHRRLKANGCVTKLFMYDDNHSLSSLAVEMDHLINSALWLQQHMQ